MANTFARHKPAMKNDIALSSSSKFPNVVAVNSINAPNAMSMTFIMLKIISNPSYKQR